MKVKIRELGGSDVGYYEDVDTIQVKQRGGDLRVAWIGDSFDSDVLVLTTYEPCQAKRLDNSNTIELRVVKTDA